MLLNQITGSLAEARLKLPVAVHKSDLSSAEDFESPNYSKKPKLKNYASTNSCPPRYIPKSINICFINFFNVLILNIVLIIIF